MASEKNFENKIKKFLETKNAWFLKYWAGAAFTKTGIPDLLVCCNGHFLGIEVKAPNGKPSPLQIHNLKLIDKAGGFGILLYPKDFELFQNFCDCLMVGDKDKSLYHYNILKSRWLNCK